MEKTFDERVREAHLTRTGAKIADYFLQNKSILAFQSLNTIASQLQISDISIVRFSRALGYEGFTDLKQHVQSELAALIDGNPENVNTLTKFTANMTFQKYAHPKTVDQLAESYCDMVHQTLARNTMDAFRRAADMLIESRHRYVVAYSSRIGAAHTMRTYLSSLLPDVYTVTSWGYDGIISMQNLTADDCVVLFSFGRAIDLEHKVLRAVQDINAKLVVISDKDDTPAAKQADVLLYSRANAGMPFFSNTCNTMLSEILCNLISTQIWPDIKDRMAAIDMQITSLSE